MKPACWSRRVVADDQVVLQPEQLVEGAGRFGLGRSVEVQTEDGGEQCIRDKAHQRVHLHQGDIDVLAY